MQIFLSYAKEDQDAARKLYESLSAIDELSPWMDERNLLPGMTWEDEIINAIEKSQFIIIILSSHSVDKTGFVQKEVKKALDRFEYYPPGKIFLIPVRIDPCEPRYPELKKLQYVDIFLGWDQGIEQITKAVKSGAEIELERVFGGFNPFLTEHRNWLRKNEEYLKDFTAKTIIEYLKGRSYHPVMELWAVDMMAGIAVKYKTDALVEYVYRIHEIAQSLSTNEFAYWPEAYGMVLSRLKSLPSRMRVPFLREMFENNVRYISRKWLRYRDTAWADDLLLRDITKHYLVQGDQSYGPADIVPRALAVFTWDIPALDLVVFHAWRFRDFDLLQEMVDILRTGLTILKKDPFYVEWSVVRSGDYLKHSDWLGFDSSKMKTADTRKQYQRVGLLLRIGEYLTYDGENENRRQHGSKLREAALQVLEREYPDVGEVIRSLRDTAESMDFFEKLELIDNEGLLRYCPQKETRQRVMKLVEEYCYAWNDTLQETTSIKLEGDIFPK